jgi:hypothetical protein
VSPRRNLNSHKRFNSRKRSQGTQKKKERSLVEVIEKRKAKIIGCLVFFLCALCDLLRLSNVLGYSLPGNMNNDVEGRCRYKYAGC